MLITITIPIHQERMMSPTYFRDSVERLCACSHRDRRVVRGIFAFHYTLPRLIKGLPLVGAFGSLPHLDERGKPNLTSLIYKRLEL